MKRVLMNKNTEVLVAEYDEEAKFFDYIYGVYDINYAHYVLKCLYEVKEDNDNSFRTNLS